MFGRTVQRHRIALPGLLAVLLLHSGVCRAGENETELRALIEEQNKQIQELKQRLDAVTARPDKGADADPAKQTRYQDVRLYARALSADEAKRLPFEDYVAELAAKPAAQWNEDEWHAVSEFYLNSVDAAYRQISG